MSAEVEPARMGRSSLRWRERDTRDNRARAFLVSLRAALEGEREESRAALHRTEQRDSATAESKQARTCSSTLTRSSDI